MTEDEWLASDDPGKMLEFLWGKATDRKLRLFAVACCRQVWSRITHPASREAVNLAEKFAEGMVPAHALEVARQLHRDSGVYRTERNLANAISAAALVQNSSGVVGLESAHEAAKYAAHAMTDRPEGGTRSYKDPSWRPLWDTARKQQVTILIHIVGNPFRPYAAPDRWPATVVQLAQALYDGQDCGFALHDALLEAGQAELAGHFRQEQAHPKGCWALDLILGKS